MLDTFHRYIPVYDEIRRDSNYPKVSVLDVGSNGVGIGRYLTEPETRITVLDLNRPPVQDTASFTKVDYVISNGIKMPFQDDTFDYVVCVGVIEHVEKEERRAFLSEITRVSKKSVLLVFPQSRAKKSEDFARWFIRNKSVFLREHETNDLPKKSDVISAFAGYRVHEKKLMNAVIWIPLKLISSLYLRVFGEYKTLNNHVFKLYRSVVYPFLNFGTPYSIYLKIEKQKT